MSSTRTILDVIQGMTQSMRSLALYLVICFFAAQFVAYFRWTNLGQILAIKGAGLIQASGMGEVPLLIALVLTQQNAQTAPVFLNSLVSGAQGREFGSQAALAVVLMIPPIVFGLAINRYLVRGLTFGAIKR